ncbi:MAG: DEAD/DEAH box helicase [Phycisphaerales bacterium]
MSFVHPSDSSETRSNPTAPATTGRKVPHAGPGITFASLGLSEQLLRTLEQEKYEAPTPIQAQTIPALLQGRDILGCASTGTGKTAAFSLPILQRLAADTATKRRPHWPRALVLAPTRELAVQIGESFATYGRGKGLRAAVIFGGVGQGPQVRALQAGVDILVATPGRLLDLVEQRQVHLGGVSIFVLDEADRMLDMGFIKPIRTISGMVGTQRQTMLFSATMPQEIRHLADSLLRDPVNVVVTPPPSAAPRIEQRVHMVHKESKQAMLQRLLEDPAVTSAVVFTRTKHGADRVMRRLERIGERAGAIHGNKNQNQRQRALEAFRTGGIRVLVATDVAARGIDIDDVSHVVNYDLPAEPESYVHRIGRTGRAGATGIAVAFCEPGERSTLRAIERLLGKPVPVAATPDDLAAVVTADLGETNAPRGGGGRGGRGQQGRGQGGRGHGGTPAKSAGKPAAKHGAKPGAKPAHAPAKPAQSPSPRAQPAPHVHADAGAPKFRSVTHGTRRLHPLSAAGLRG